MKTCNILYYFGICLMEDFNICYLNIWSYCNMGIWWRSPSNVSGGCLSVSVEPLCHGGVSLPRWRLSATVRLSASPRSCYHGIGTMPLCLAEVLLPRYRRRHTYPEWRIGKVVASHAAVALIYTMHEALMGTAHGGGGAISQLDLPSVTPLSVPGCGWLKLGVPHWAASVHYCK